MHTSKSGLGPGFPDGPFPKKHVFPMWDLLRLEVK